MRFSFSRRRLVLPLFSLVAVAAAVGGFLSRDDWRHVPLQGAVGDASCPNGDIDPGEQCEIGYPCPAGLVCIDPCICINPTPSSSSAAPVSSEPASSSATSSSSSESDHVSSASDCVQADQVETEGFGQCCAGLDTRTIEMPDESGSCLQFDPSMFVCVDCGDGVCSLMENECICAADCTDDTGDDDNGDDDSDDSADDDDTIQPQSSSRRSQPFEPLEPRCGDWMLQPGEECEYGVECLVPGQTCDESRCACDPVCHDPLRVKDPTEQCEVDTDCPGTQFCDSECRCVARPSYCGDGMVDESSGEQCESNGDCAGGEMCGADCRCVMDVSVCGDGVQEGAEECENDAQCPSGSACNRFACACVQLPEVATGTYENVCGDGILDGAEQCEWDHPCTATGLLCDPRSCICIGLETIRSVCGDGLREGTEECDADTPCSGGRTCNSSLCICEDGAARCGDGKLDAGEACEKGIACPSGKLCDVSRCRCQAVAICGNGTVDPGEQCDDQNIRSGDGCSDNCKTEKLVASARCGDGVLQVNEGCDDGNRKSGDGCSSTCSREQVAVQETLPAAIIELPFALQPQAEQQRPAASPAVTIMPMLPLRVAYPSPMPPATTSTGPAAVMMIAAGAAAGYAYVRRRK